MVRFALAALVLAATLLGHSACGNELVLLDFWSPSCGPCMQMKPTVHSLVNAGYPVREVDCTRDPQLARQFQVDHIPCFVMLVDGQEIDRVVGATTSERLVQMFDRARVRLQSPDVRPATPASIQPAPLASVGNDSARSVPDALEHSVPVEPIQTPPTTAAEPLSPDSSSKLLAASVRLRVDDAKGHSYGTGTIIDARQGEALVITCGHLFRESQGKGPVTVELFEAEPQGTRVVDQVPGQVISYDLERDLSLLSIRPGRPVSVAPIAPPRAVIDRGDRVASVGCSNGKDPSVIETRITSLDRYQGPPNIEASGAPVEGRSGGGLFNDKGQLVGVCFAADYEGNEGLYAALESIHGELDRLGMKVIYSQTGSAVNNGEAAVPATPPAPMEPVVRGQEPLAPVMPLPERDPKSPPAESVAIDPATAETAAPQGLATAEQAAWEEIMNRAATHEVICIIRPKEPGGQSEVITLDDVSPEFARALLARQRESQAPIAR